MTTKYIFDLDGTITHTDYQSESQFLIERLGEDARIFLPRKVELLLKYESLYERYETKRLSQHFKNYGFNISPQVVDEWINFACEVTVLPQMDQLILTLADQNKELVLLSNWFAQTQKEKLRRVNLLSYFNTIIGGDTILKPDPRSYLLAMGRTPIENCVMIGDNYDKDYLGAINVGMEAYHITNQNREEVIRKLRLK